MLKYTISILTFALCNVFAAQAQLDSTQVKVKDTLVEPQKKTVRHQKYGLRVGVDLSKPIMGRFIDGYQGIEFVGDYRLSQKLFAAAEIGNEKKLTEEDLYSFTTQGSYFKAGVDYNTYANWYGEQNLIYFGGRYAVGTFNHTLHNYDIFDDDRFWSPDSYVLGGEEDIKFEGRSAHWLEAVVGAKAELFGNIYMGISGRIGFLLTGTQKAEFWDLYVPGFNKVTDGSRFGLSFNYSISYLIPLYKKETEIKVQETIEKEEIPREERRKGEGRGRQ